MRHLGRARFHPDRTHCNVELRSNVVEQISCSNWHHLLMRVQGTYVSAQRFTSNAMCRWHSVRRRFARLLAHRLLVDPSASVIALKHRVCCDCECALARVKHSAQSDARVPRLVRDVVPLVRDVRFGARA
jgi:hypothetical protein